MRRTDDKLLSTFLDDSSVCVNSCHIIKLLSTKSVSYKFAIGLLNSSLIQFLFEIQNPQMIGKTFAEIKVIYISLLPIIEPTKRTKMEIEKIVDEILMRKQADFEYDTLILESEIDKLVYELYGLTKEEIQTIEQ